MMLKYAIVAILFATPALAAEKIIAPVVNDKGEVIETLGYKVKIFADHAECQAELDSEPFKLAVADAQKNFADPLKALGSATAGATVKPECVALVSNGPAKEEK